MLLHYFSVLPELYRGNVPALVTDIDQIKGNQIFAGMSCFQITHQTHFYHPYHSDDVNDRGAVSDMLAVFDYTTVVTPHPIIKST